MMSANAVLAVSLAGWMIPVGMGAALLAAVLYYAALRKKNMNRWLGRFYWSQLSGAQSTNDGETKHIFLAVCDHFEPRWHQPTHDVALKRVQRWCDEYPRLFSMYRDSLGRCPQHTFFFPQDEYHPDYLDMLAELCADGFGEVDVHLHHDNDTAEGFRQKLTEFRDTLYHRHGLLRQDPVTGEIVYGFIHGNWALCNSRSDGRWCGVDNEIPILRETGCYADFTMPSAPSDTQTQTINSIYYASDRPGCRKSHDTGIPASVGCTPDERSLLMIQGPLVPNWRQAKWGVFPRTENGDLHVNQPATLSRFQNWMRANVHVQGRANWLFAKLHTHGAKDGNIDTFLSSRTQDFHTQLADYARENSQLKYYYVTAWEMAQLVHAAERGVTDPAEVLLDMGQTVADSGLASTCSC